MDARARQIAIGISFLDPEVIVLTEVRTDSAINEIVNQLNVFGSSYTARVVEPLLAVHNPIGPSPSRQPYAPAARTD